MGKKSRNKANREEKLAKARLFNQQQNTSSINGGILTRDPEITALPEGEIIPSKAAEDPDIIEPAEKILSINFRPKSLDNNEIDVIQKGDAKALVHKLFCVNKMSKSETQRNGIIRDKVNNTGNFSFLYNDLAPDIDVLEIKFKQTGRVFGFFTQDVFNVVAVRTQHIQ